MVNYNIGVPAHFFYQSKTCNYFEFDVSIPLLSPFGFERIIWGKLDDAYTVKILAVFRQTFQQEIILKSLIIGTVSDDAQTHGDGVTLINRCYN